MLIEAQDTKFPAFNPDMWKERAAGGYGQLGWVNAKGPIEELIKQSELQGHETVIDLGTGTRTILEVLSPQISTGKLIGLDISNEMLTDGAKNPRHGLIQADTCAIPLPNSSADLVTARMVFHHLPNIPQALKEVQRILRPGGKAIIGEYVAVDNDVLAFEQVVFDTKEAGRHLWTGPQLGTLISENWDHTPGSQIVLGYGVMPQYSVRDWMGKSGLSRCIQEKVLNFYLKAPELIIKKMAITYTNNGDALVDRPFAFVKAVK